MRLYCNNYLERNQADFGKKIYAENFLFIVAKVIVIDFHFRQRPILRPRWLKLRKAQGE
jgi:hypothetical protein